MLLTKIRKTKGMKTFSLFMAFTLLFQFSFPVGALALTGGPSQPEVQSFEPIGTSEMVDPFSGDFTYNIPLMDVGGYPINISYNAGAANMDAEASWVGLGWNINPGVINRNMRSLPDDFNGDVVKREYNVKPNKTYGANTSVTGEIFGIDFSKLNLSVGMGLSYNNYKGIGFSVSANSSIGGGDGSKTGLTAGLGLSASSGGGVDISPSVSFSGKIDNETEKGLSVKAAGSVGANYNSRGGLKAINFSASAKLKKNRGNKKPRKLGVSGSTDISFVTNTYTPQLSMPMENQALSFRLTLGAEVYGTHPLGNLDAYYSSQSLRRKADQTAAYGYLYTQNGHSLFRVLYDFNRQNDGSFNKFTPVLPITNFSYDVLSVSGQGIGGSYRPYRSDIGILYDTYGSNTGSNIDIPGFEAGMGGLVRGGLNTSVVSTESRSGRWILDNSLLSKLKFRGKTSDPLYEPFYFKQAGELTPENDLAFFNQIGRYDPVKIGLNTNSKHVAATSNFVKRDGAQIPLTDAGTVRKKRDRRNETIAMLTAAEASKFGISRKIETFPTGNFSFAATGAYKGQYIPSLNNRVDSDHKAHHISELQAFRADGARYVYGIPLYNLHQEDVSFAVAGVPDCTTGLIDYSTMDATVDNKWT